MFERAQRNANFHNRVMYFNEKSSGILERMETTKKKLLKESNHNLDNTITKQRLEQDQNFRETTKKKTFVSTKKSDAPADTTSSKLKEAFEQQNAALPQLDKFQSQSVTAKVPYFQAATQIPLPQEQANKEEQSEISEPQQQDHSVDKKENLENMTGIEKHVKSILDKMPPAFQEELQMELENEFVDLHDSALQHIRDGNYHEAVNGFTKLLQYSDMKHGENSEESGAFLLQIIFAMEQSYYLTMQLPTDLMKYYERAVPIVEQTMQKSRNLAYIYNQFGNLNLLFGNADKAEEFHLRSLQKCQIEGMKIENKDRNILFENYVQLGILSGKKYDYQKGLDYFRNAQKIRDTYTLRLHMGDCLMQLNNEDEALECLELGRMLAVEEYGVDNEIQILFNNRIGSVYLSKGMYDSAQPYLEYAENIIQKKKGIQQIAEHLAYAAMDNLKQLGMVYVHQKNIKKGLEKFWQFYQMVCGEYCATHYMAGTALNQIGIAHVQNKEYDVGINFMQQSMSIFNNCREDQKDYLEMSYAQANLATALFSTCDFKEARKWFDAAYTIRRMLYGNDHQKTVELLENIKMCDQKIQEEMN